MKTLTLKTRFICICLLFSMKSFAQGYGEIRGIIKDSNLEPVPYATVKILQGTQLISGTQTDENGRYVVKPLNPGDYEMLVIEPGHVTQPVNKIKVTPNEASYVDVKLTVKTLDDVIIVAKPIDFLPNGVDRTTSIVKSFTGLELKQVAGYSAGDIKGSLVSLTSEVIESPGGEVHFRGARGDASGYFVDGVRTLRDNTIPGLGIENLTVLSGGIPAMYGDVTSGVVVITTKSYFSGIREKNIRENEYREKRREEKAKQKAKEDEENRLKEIEEEKAKEKQQG